jgi:FeS assembly protein IscX
VRSTRLPLCGALLGENTLHEKFPDLDPATIRFTDLHKWITELDDFDDDPMKSNEAKLERIQMTWMEEYNEDRG